MEKKYIVKLEEKEWKEILDKVFNKKKKDIKVDGFRKGQISKETYLKKFGIESLYMDGVDIAIPMLLDKILSDKETITPACRPSVDIKNINEKELEMEFSIIGVPDVKLGKYKDLKVKKEEAEVTKEEIEHEIEHLRNNYADFKVLDDGEKIKNGHTAIIDFEGFVDGKAFDGGKGLDHNLVIGSGQFIPGFEEQLIGLKKGEEKDVVVTFPKNYPAEELKGKEATFKVKVNDIKEKILPELNEDFFKDLGEKFKTVEEFEKEVENNIKHGKQRRIDDDYISLCLDKVVEKSDYEVPEEMIDDEVERLVHEFEHQLSHQGFQLENYIKMMNTNMEDFKKQLRGEAERRIGYRLIIDAICAKENFEVTDKEIDKYAEENSVKYGITKEEYIKEIGSTDLIKHDIKAKKALQLVTQLENID